MEYGFIFKTYDFLKRRKWLAVLLPAVAAGLSLLSISRMHGDEDISSFLPQDEMTGKYTSVYERLGGKEKIAVFFRGDDAGEICSAMDLFGELLTAADTSGMVRDLRTEADAGAVLDVMDFIRENRPYFLTEDDYRRADSLLAEPRYIERRLAEAHRSLLYPGSSFTAGNLRHDPLGLFSTVFARLSELNPAGKGKIVDGHVFLPDSSAGVAFLDSPFGGSESGRNSQLVKMLDDVSRETEHAFPGVVLSMTGGPVIAVENARAIRRDSVLALSLSLLLISILLYFQFRNLKDVLWTGLSILCGGLFSLGLISLFKSSLSIIILGAGSMILGIAVNYPLHYVDCLKYQPDTRKALRNVISPLTVGNLTTVLAFLSLSLMKSPALRDFGAVGAMMLAGTIVFVIIFLPVLMPDGVKRSDKALRLRTGRLHLPRKARHAALLAAVLLTAVFSFTGKRTGFDPDLHGINYMTPSQKSGLEALASLAGRDDGSETVYAVTSAPSLDEALEKNGELLRNMSAAGQYDVSSICSFVPSRREQERRLALWDDFTRRHSGLPETVRKAALSEGFSAGAFLPFEEEFAAEHRPQPAEFFAPLISTLGRQFILSDTTIVNYAHVPPESRESLESLWNSSLSDASTFFFSSADLGSRLVALLSEEFDGIGLVCGLTVFLFLWFSFGRIELSVIAFLPLAVSWVWILGIMGIFSMKFNIVNIILATFIFGQGDDYTIFVTEGLMYEHGTGKKILDAYGNGIVFSALMMFAGMGTLIFARHPAMRSLAEVTIAGMFTVVLLSCCIPPLVFRSLTMKDGVRRECPVTLRRLLYSLLALLFFSLTALFMVPCAKIASLSGVTDRKRLRCNRFLNRLCGFIIRHIPGVELSWKNVSGETFGKPAVIVCNHQSHLDVMFLLSLSEKIVFLTNDRVWNNVFYRSVIRIAGFCPVSEGLENNGRHLASLVEQGYSVVVFPEGTRSADCSIGRFHRGAFEIAEKLGLDILPVVIHGFGHVLPKNDTLLREGEIYGEVLPRIPLSAAGDEVRARTRWFRSFYVSEYGRIRGERETPEYFIPYIKLQYAYKGKAVEAECRRQLSDLSWAEAVSGETSCLVRNCGVGAGALALALSRPGMEVCAVDSDAEKLAVAAGCAGVPGNLHFMTGEEG